MGGVSFPYGVYCNISGGIYYRSFKNMPIFISKAFSIVLGIRYLQTIENALKRK